MSTVKWRLVAALATAVLIAGCTSSGGADDSAAGDQRPTLHQPSESVDDPADGEEADADSNAQEEREEGRAPDEEAEEEAELTEKRVEALKDARKEGVFGRGIDMRSKTTPGWTDERLLNAETDDWEPALAADPQRPTSICSRPGTATARPLREQCPSPFLAMTISDDGGRTWDLQHALCICRGAKAQYDPTIEVVPETGDVYSAFSMPTGAWLLRRRSPVGDHGQTWTKPVHVYGKVRGPTSPRSRAALTEGRLRLVERSDRGRPVRRGVARLRRDVEAAQAHDSKRYYYAYDARTMPTAPSCSPRAACVYGPKDEVEGKVWHHAVISRDGGATWEDHVIAKVPVGESVRRQGLLRATSTSGRRRSSPTRRPSRLRLRGSARPTWGRSGCM